MSKKMNCLGGFSLIELLVVIALMGILFTIAIQKFYSYRLRAYNSSALYDLRNLINDEVCYFSIKQSFAGFSVLNATSKGIIEAGDFEHKYLSKDIRAVAKVDVSGSYMNLCVKNTNGDLIYAYQSEENKIYWKKSKVGYELQDSDCPDATSDDDFSASTWHVLAQSK